MLEGVQIRAMKLKKGLDHKSDQKQRRDLVGLSLEKIRLMHDLFALHNSLKEGCSQVGSISSPREQGTE